MYSIYIPEWENKCNFPLLNIICAIAIPVSTPCESTSRNIALPILLFYLGTCFLKNGSPFTGRPTMEMQALTNFEMDGNIKKI